jgi:hypothetical protein
MVILFCWQQDDGLSYDFLDPLDYGREVGIRMGWDDKWLGLFEGLTLGDFLIVAQVTRIVVGG